MENQRSINTPLVSVIIATYNCSKALRCAITSVINQDFENFEVWIIGDCCTDNSEDVVKEFNDHRLNWFNLPFNYGSQSGPNNEGIKRSRGKYIAYLGHDDLWFPNHLSALIECITESDSDFVHCLSFFINSKGAYASIGPPPLGRTYSNSHIPPSSWLYKKTITEECGYWKHHTELRKGVDQDYLNRISMCGKKINFKPGLFVVKFCSADWKIYSLNEGFPQINFLKRIEENPSELSNELLFEIATSMSYYFMQRIPFLKSLKRFIDNFLFIIYDVYSRERWPLKQFLIYHFNNQRTKIKKNRGLTN